MRETVTLALLAAGMLIELFSVVGVCVMRDVFDRLHCVSLAGYGVFLIGLSILVRESFSLLGDKAMLTGVCVVLLSPVLVHTTARSLRIRLLGDWRESASSAATRGPR